MQLFVQLLSARTVVVDVDDPSCYTLGDLKAALEVRSGVPTHLQHLTLGGRHLSEDSQLLDHYHVAG